MMTRARATLRRKEGHSPSLRRLAAKLTLVVSLLFGSLLAFPGTAHAAEFWTCGHLVRTSYDQGWVILDSMSGVAGRNDIVVDGPTRDGYWTTARADVAAAYRFQWALLDYTYILFINGDGSINWNCSTPLR